MSSLAVIDKNSFTCPHCGTFSHQYWYNAHAFYLEKDAPNIVNNESAIALLGGLGADERDRLKRVVSGEVFLGEGGLYANKMNNVYFSRCHSCDGVCIWRHKNMIYPDVSVDIKPNPDMPDEIKDDFIEAGNIFKHSPRSSAALLRLAIQKLCDGLDAKGKNINEQIADLVQKGLDPSLQQALDYVRVVGNNAVHPGEIDIKDDPAIAESLFGLINIIVDNMISRPKKIKDLYQSLPEGARNAIEKRDAKK